MTLVAIIFVALVLLLFLAAQVQYRRICRRDAQRHAVSARHAGRTRL